MSYAVEFHQMNSIDDHALMLKVKTGDVGKLNLLYSRYSRRLFGYFYRMTSDGSTSEDLVQNVFERVLKYKHSYSEDGHFEVWVFQLARNVHRDHFRKNKRYDFQEDMSSWEKDLSHSSNQEAEMTKSDELRFLQKALSMLDEEKRELIELVKFQKVKYARVAELLGTSESAVKVRVHRTLKELKDAYLKLDV